MSETKRIYYNKLIRDNIPAKIAAKGQECEVRQITDPQELQQELLRKVQEEANALAMCRCKKDFLEEYTDLMVALEALLDQLLVTDEELLVVREANLQKKGIYEEGHYLHWSDDVDYRSNESVQGIAE